MSSYIHKNIIQSKRKSPFAAYKKAEEPGEKKGTHAVICDENGAKLLKAPELNAPTLSIIPFNSHVYILSRQSQFLFIETEYGEKGFVEAPALRTNMPDPDSVLYKIQHSDTPEKIANLLVDVFPTNFGKEDWGLALHKLIEYNQGFGNVKAGIYTSKSKVERASLATQAKVRAGAFIWIPGEFTLNENVNLHAEQVSTKDITQLWGAKQKADAILNYLKENKTHAVVEVFRSATNESEFIKIQEHIEEKMKMWQLLSKLNNNWALSLIGSFGPLLSGYHYLNYARAELIIHYCSSGFPEFVSEIFTLYILSTAYDNDIKEVLTELDSKNRLPETILKMKSVKALLADRGIKLDSYKKEDRGFLKGAAEGFGNMLAPELKQIEWEFDMQSLPVIFRNAINNARYDLITSSIANPLQWVDYLTLNIPSTLIGVGTGLVGGLSSLAKGKNEEAGKELVGPVLFLSGILGYGIKLKNAQALKSTKTENGFVLVGYDGPLPKELARLSALLELTDRSGTFLAGLYKAIGKEGIIRLALDARKSAENVLFLHKHGLEGAIALYKAKGDVVKAERFMQYGVFEPKQIQPKKLINTPYLKQYLNIRLGERLDKPTDTSISSMMKEVYVVEREPDKVIAILKDASEIVRLNQELELLTELENMGIDVVEVIGRTKHHGKDAIIMKRYSKSSKSILDLVNNKLKIVGPYEANSLNINSLRSLQKIQAKLLENAIAISDLQFLIEADGTFVLNDPLGVLHKNKPRYTDYAKENFKIIDTFIELSADNIVREKLKTNPQIIWHKTKLLESFVDVIQSDVLLDGTLQRLLDRGALEDLGNGQYKLKKKINSKN